MVKELMRHENLGRLIVGRFQNPYELGELCFN
jgi:hypothetical protein